MTSTIRTATTIRRAPAELVDRFRAFPVANLGDAMDRIGIVDSGITPLWDGAAAVGSALPVQSVAGDNLALIEVLDRIQPGDFIAVNAAGYTDRAVMGDNLAQRFQAFGAVGAVVDGSARDRDVIRRFAFPVWSRGVSPAGPFKNGPGSIGSPIALGGVVVAAGDIIAADGDGLIVVPLERAEEVLAGAEEIARIEVEKDEEAARFRAAAETRAS
ncbi:RraA family protein [Curtobacterium sp. VKM Ac-2887]|uniref:RraA family protein n=1 Tax=Curtobacterium sp. VKM Ac-2887 TaxID=2783819 RepID=UPI001889F920|nr:RraA family protein [Curtobacterium sp. VKM Ac-2887]MBF4588271.1 RraA family protein [Curtobacterium sp. VKM Ac-2887]